MEIQLVGHLKLCQGTQQSIMETAQERNCLVYKAQGSRGRNAQACWTLYRTPRDLNARHWINVCPSGFWSCFGQVFPDLLSFFPSRLWMPALPFCIGMCSFPFFLHRLMARSVPWVSGETLNLCLWIVLKMLRFHSISGEGLNASYTTNILGPRWRVMVSCVERSVSIWGALIWEALETLGVGFSWKK